MPEHDFSSTTARAAERTPEAKMSHLPTVLCARAENAVEIVPSSFVGMEAALALITACNAHLREDKVVKIRLGFTVTPEIDIEITNRSTSE